VLLAGGLNAGETIVTAGVHVLTEGQKVRRYVEPAGPASQPVPGLPPAQAASAAPVASR
jgi:membrane fusion protein, multidrug efflux system